MISANVLPAPGLARNHFWAAGTLLACGALLLILPMTAAALDQRELRVFDSFYRAGSLVFGGGHVVLPLLRAEVVPPGWIGDDPNVRPFVLKPIP